MTASIVRKVKFITIASTLISTAGVFTALNINKRAEAIVVSGDPNNYLVSPGTGYDVLFEHQSDEKDLLG